MPRMGGKAKDPFYANVKAFDIEEAFAKTYKAVKKAEREKLSAGMEKVRDMDDLLALLQAKKEQS